MWVEGRGWATYELSCFGCRTEEEKEEAGTGIEVL